jgi:hypothetical protein
MKLVAVLALAAAIIPGFKSPTGNIRCAALPNVLHCDIAHADYAAKLQYNCLNPNGEMGAGVDWHGFEVPRTGKASAVCSGGIWYTGSRPPRYVTLPYSRTWRVGVFTCSSRVTGVTCRNRAGHGVFISRERYRLF